MPESVDIIEFTGCRSGESQCLCVFRQGEKVKNVDITAIEGVLNKFGVGMLRPSQKFSRFLKLLGSKIPCKPLLLLHLKPILTSEIC